MSKEPNFRINLVGGFLDGERFPIYDDVIPIHIGLTNNESLQNDHVTEYLYKLHCKTTMKDNELDLIEMSYRYVGSKELSDEIKNQMIEDTQ